MSMSDPLGDMLARIKNAQRAKKSDVVSPASRLRENVLEVLKREYLKQITVQININHFSEFYSRPIICIMLHRSLTHKKDIKN